MSELTPKRWTKPDNFSVDRHQELQDAADAVASLIPAEDGTEVRQGPFGRSISTLQRLIQAGWVVVKITSKTTVKTADNGTTASVNLGGGWYSGRSQVIKGGSRDPSANLSLSAYFQDSATGVDDVYVMYIPETATSAHALAIDGTLYVLGQWDGFNDLATVDTRPIVRVDLGSGLPTGTGQYKVLQLIDGANPGTPGWDWVRFHA